VRSELDVLPSDSGSSESPTVGSKDQILETIDAYWKLGVKEMVFSVSTDDTERIRTVMENFAEKVMNHSK
jgi:alkanesulfonate monooxygenase SsuD/methylene tetrahydromethanopterin reductase-like flavin-dependent oxidoreductase (luciferase family)